MNKTVTVQLDFREDIDKYLKKNFPAINKYRIVKKSLDARGAPRGKAPTQCYVVELLDDFSSHNKVEERVVINTKVRPIIVGLGPAGLFAALKFIEAGIYPIILERGGPIAKRTLDIVKFWKHGVLNINSNVCFGEGGAGLFSDGKLLTRVKSPYVQYVMDQLVKFGAPAEMAYLNAPHLGSNKMKAIISSITDYLQKSGATILYNSLVTELIVEQGKVAGVKLDDKRVIHSPFVLLATGHSARDVYSMLERVGVTLSAKDFAVGVRVEHKRSFIDKSQYGNFAGDLLGAANYRLAYHDKVSDRGCYSFCMCPGGVVLSAGTESNGLVVNGMSNAGRNGRYSNSAIVVAVKAGVDFKGVLGGIAFQKEIENRAYDLSVKVKTGKELPAQNVADFLEGKVSKNVPDSSVPSKTFSADLTQIFPLFILDHLRNGFVQFEKNIPGIIKNGLMIAPETRTSSPVRIDRDKNQESVSTKGLYPCGEGAGFAGGITSAAVDGVSAALNVIKIISNSGS